MSVVAIVNPISGAAPHADVAARRGRMLSAEAARHRIAMDIRVTEGPGHAREMAAAAAASATRLVIVWGGDGTMNEVCSAVIGCETVVALVPAGSGNGLAAALSIPHDPASALRIAFDAPAVTIDAGSIGGRPFFNIAGLGLDARIARLFNERAPGRRGALPYMWIGVREGCRYAGCEYSIDLDGDVRRTRALLVAFANGTEYGNGACIAPSARLDDGLLDAVIVEDRPVIERFWQARHLATRTAHLAAGVTLAKVKRAAIEAKGPVDVHVDGESCTMEGRLEVAVLPRAVKMKAGPDFRAQGSGRKLKGGSLRTSGDRESGTGR